MAIKIPTSKEDYKDILKRAKDIISSSPVGIVFVFGALLVLAPFFHHDAKIGWQFPLCPTGLIWLIPVFGVVLLLIGTFMCCNVSPTKLIYKGINIKKNPLILTFGSSTVTIKVGKIQELIGCDKTVAVVLGANTTFVDDCATDAHSAFGAFNLKHCPSKISELREFIDKELKADKCQQECDGTYLIGTTLNLTSFYERVPSNVFLTASTVKKKSVGFKASPTSICECIRQIFEHTADQRISVLHMPILGSGRGGLPIHTALLLQLISIKHYLTLFPHIKTVNIIVLEKDAKEIPDYIRNLQYAILPL